MILCDLTQGWLYRVKYSSYAKLLMSFLCSLYTSDEFTEQEPPLFDRAKHQQVGISLDDQSSNNLKKGTMSSLFS